MEREPAVGAEGSHHGLETDVEERSQELQAWTSTQTWRTGVHRMLCGKYLQKI